jgi:F-type H+-transporting ATPase subunit gamma
VVSSDRGLCGGIHSSVTKSARKLLAEEANQDARLVVLGDKSKSQLQRLVPDSLVLTFNQIGKDVPTFADAAVIADYITKSGVEYDSVRYTCPAFCVCNVNHPAYLLQVNIVYNRFVSAISYEASVIEVVNEGALREARK